MISQKVGLFSYRTCNHDAGKIQPRDNNLLNGKIVLLVTVVDADFYVAGYKDNPGGSFGDAAHDIDGGASVS